MTENEFQSLLVFSITKYKDNNEAFLHIADEIISIQGLSPQKVLAIYAEDYRYRLLLALQQNYSKLHQHLGDQIFTTISFKYIDQYPSSHYNLNKYGEYFLAFLKSNHFPEEALNLCQDEAIENKLFDYQTPRTALNFNLLGENAFLELKLPLYGAFEFYQNNFYYKNQDGIIKKQTIEMKQMKILRHLFSGQSIGQTLNEISIDADPNDITSLFNFISAEIRHYLF